LLNRTTTISAALIIIVGFTSGFALGRIDPHTIIRITQESYTNRYLSMSGAARQKITYYVYSKPAAVPGLVADVPGVISIEKAPPKNLYDVVIDYPSRREVVRSLRSIPEVSAVFTVPLICH